MNKKITLITLVYGFCSICSAAVLQLSDNNATKFFESSKFCLVNFYADWCRYSQALTPIIDEAAQQLEAEFPEGDQLVIGKVDCVVETRLAKTFGVTKYPTLKIFRSGYLQRREYRGQRSVDAILAFVRSQMSIFFLTVLTDPVDATALPLEAGKGALVGRFASNESAGFKVFSRVADQMSESCRFIAVVGSNESRDSVVFQKGLDSNAQTPVSVINERFLQSAVEDNCVTIARELTFENAEETVEEGKPMLILFYRADDTTLVEKYKAAVEQHLKQYSDRFSFLYGQGPLFIRALRQMRRTVNDLPVLAIDSIQHMYAFPWDVRETLTFSPKQLVNFLEDLISGKLHTEFHKAAGGDNGVAAMVTEPPISVFRRLGPSQARYSFTKEEL